MTVIATVLTALVAFIHVYIVILEMALWDTPRGRAAFGTSRELAAQTKVLAANQGLYNGFLVAGLLLALLGPEVTASPSPSSPSGASSSRGSSVPSRRADGSCGCRRSRRHWPSRPTSSLAEAARTPHRRNRLSPTVSRIESTIETRIITAHPAAPPTGRI